MLTVWEVQEQDTSVAMVWWRLATSQPVPPHSVLVWWKGWRSLRSHLYKALTPFMRAPRSWFKHLSKAPAPHTITSDIRVSTQKLCGGHKHSDDSEYISSIFSFLTFQCIWKRQIFKFVLLPVDKLSEREICNSPKSTGKWVPLTGLKVTSRKSYCVLWLGILISW